MSDFREMLKGCRNRFVGARSGFLAWFGLKKAVYNPLDTVPVALRPHYELLLKKGDVVWGALAQVNEHMFRPGREDLPGVLVYSEDPACDDNVRIRSSLRAHISRSLGHSALRMKQSCAGLSISLTTIRHEARGILAIDEHSGEVFSTWAKHVLVDLSKCTQTTSPFFRSNS